MKRKVSLALAAFVMVLLLMPATPTAQAGSSAQVLPLNSSPYGNTYGEWSARWWQWVMGIPQATNPNFDTTGANCGVGQVGPVWFLAGSFGGAATRHCHVPAGKALLLSPLNQLDGAGAGDCTPTGTGPCNLKALRALAAAATDNPKTLEVDVDGHQLSNVRQYRVRSPVFSLTYPTGAVFGLPAGTTTPNLSDGYWLMLAPLSSGKHIIHFKGTGNSGFTVEITYQLTIGP